MPIGIPQKVKQLYRVAAFPRTRQVISVFVSNFIFFFFALINQDEFWIAVGTIFRPNLDGVIFSFRFCFVTVIQFFYDTRERLLDYFNWGIYCYGWELTTVMTNKLNTIYEYPRGTSMQLLSQSIPRCDRTVTKMARAVKVTSFVRR